MIRWQASAVYLTEAGTLLVEYDLEELSELHGIVERGPSWDSIINIVVVKRHVGRALTVEETAQL